MGEFIGLHLCVCVCVCCYALGWPRVFGVVSECVVWMQASKALWNLVGWDEMWMEVCFGGALTWDGGGEMQPLTMGRGVLP